jgi:hypothetical protein
LLELEEINNYLDSDENEHWYNKASQER